MTQAGTGVSPVRLILASASPRRAALLAMGALPFTVETSPFDEVDLPYEGDQPVASWVEAVALAKAAAVPVRPGTIVLGADTAVVRGGRVYGKPQDPAQARAFLEELAGGWHDVITGVALCGPEHGHVRHALTRVHMRPMSASMRDAYVATGEPLDKAGAYAIQGVGSLVVDRIEGCYTNVVGLSLPLLDDMLSSGFGVSLLVAGAGRGSPADHTNSFSIDTTRE